MNNRGRLRRAKAIAAKRRIRSASEPFVSYVVTKEIDSSRIKIFATSAEMAEFTARNIFGVTGFYEGELSVSLEGSQ